jgi:hypothetical protein
MEFEVSEHFYVHNLQAAVRGIKDSMSSDLSRVVGLMFP